MSEPEKQKTVLVADDELHLLLLLRDSLEEAGFRVLTAADGEQALHEYRSEKPDVVILDVEMPKMNGWEVCERIRREGTLGPHPVIMILSAYTQPEDIKKGIRLGANKYFTKPFKMKELIDAIQNSVSEKSR